MSKSIFIATAVYEHLVTGYVQSLVPTIALLEREGFIVQWRVCEGCCYIHTARNKLTRDFLVSGYDEMVFTDADLGWQAEDFLKLVRQEKEIVGGAVPFRQGNPGFPARHLTDAKGFPLVDKESGLIRVDVLPTAMMKIKREVFLKIALEGKAKLRLEHDRATLQERERYLSFFDFEPDDPACVEYGEDVSFCRKWLSLKGEIWVQPDMTFKHYGMSHREGNFHDHLRALPGGGGEVPKEWKFEPRTKPLEIKGAMPTINIAPLMREAK